ncbi:ferritin-like domain-containing protein [Salegentibacter chungangensis]|uniref:PA2169 family four-helix-bundle protein n=1 Tax=Salegentibacter chungangensis TaxID=1335724 RepID=A0ABW3NTR0_9FLAO
MKTTREAAKEDSHKTLVHNLQELLEKNYDAEKGYKKALEHVKNSQLKTFLKDQAVQRNHFATELDKYIHELNEHPKEHTSPLSNLHRFWIDFKSTISKQSDKDILEECIRGEKASLKEYEEKLKKYTFPPHIKDVLKAHIAEIKDTISSVKTMEDL